MNKKQLLTESKTFCMLPWVHFNTNPNGDALPCCIAKPPTHEHFGFKLPLGNTTKSSMMEIVNSTRAKQLRLDMLTGIRNPMCSACHEQDDLNLISFRCDSNKKYAKHFDNAMATTDQDGSLSEFKMRYFDIRFSNICNFKCRTCGPDWSSQWEQENIKNNIYQYVIIKNDNKEFLKEIIDQIPNFEEAYFAGGEPLITEEHYILLEEMIKQGRTDIVLRYNTNLSNLKFKNKDLLGLWSHFTNKVQVYASIDHYGARAEYIRHGTDWAVVEENFLLAKKSSNIQIQMNTVLSLYNYTTFLEFYQYLADKGLYSDSINSIYYMNSPEFLTSKILPYHHKEQGKTKILKLIDILTSMNILNRPDLVTLIHGIIDWTMAPSEHTWEKYKEEFQTTTEERDEIRGESFVKTFPELADLMEN